MSEPKSNVEYVIVGDVEGVCVVAEVYAKTQTVDSEGYVLGITPPCGNYLSVFQGDSNSLGKSNDPFCYNEIAPRFQCLVADKHVLAEQLRQLANLLEGIDDH